MAQLLGLLAMVIDAQEGKLSENEQRSLAGELEGALVGTSRTASRRKLLGRIKGRDWDYIAGHLRKVIDENEARAAGGISVSASSTSVAKVDIDISFTQMREYYGVIDSSDGFTEEQKEQLKELISEVLDAGRRGDCPTFSKKLAKWLGITADSVEIWQAFAPVIAAVFTALVNQT